ncbi:MAG: ATP-binding cassette domain-containing protein, partial [Pseudomonadota bacterium]|nr:ATP-binding cassette domain-containing protein [Pseudomonadota bacterium]
MLKFTNVFKNYDKSVLADINIEVEEGEFISILGPSGSGKSTILRLASKLIRPSRGEISYKNNKPPSIGFVFQDATLMPWRNVLDNIILPLELNGVRRNISTKKAA